MCFRRNRNDENTTRQQRRKLQRDVAKLEKKVRRMAIHTLNDESIPKWIRDVKRKQMERSGFIIPKNN